MTPRGRSATVAAGQHPSLPVRALLGVLAAACALAVAQAAAAFLGPTGAPVTAVGAAVVDATPIPLKEFAIRTFGESDKTVLLGGVLLAVFLYAGLVGAVAFKAPRLAVAGVLGFGVLGALAASTRPGAQWQDAVPSLLGGVVGAAVLLLLVRSASLRFQPAPTEAGDGPDADGPDLGTGPATGAVLSTGRRRPSFGELLAGTDRASMRYDRRGLLLTAAGLAVVSAAVGGVAQRVVGGAADVAASRARVRLPKPVSAAPALPAAADLGVAELTPFLTPNPDFYRVDTALLLPRVTAEGWSLRVHGMVDRELRLTYDDLLEMPMTERHITLTCVSNEVGGPYAGNARWLGVPLADVLRRAGVARGSDQLVSRSSDGWTCGTPVAAVLDGRDALLAVGMNGEPLPQEHGFPVRMVVPGLYGYVSATKWLVDLELTTFAAYDPYWVERGYAAEAPIKTMARIDTPKPLATLASGEVAIGGVAWAQHTGIDAVEVRVDGGDWQQARLSDEVGIDTWRQWVLPWRPDPGRHTLEARAVDRVDGPQTDARAKPFPDGATGWHSVVVTAAA